MSVSIRLLYFAAVREATGRSEESIPLENVGTVADLAGWLQTRYPQLVGRLSTVRFAINETFVPLQAELADGDVVAVIPPVAGG